MESSAVQSAFEQARLIEIRTRKAVQEQLSGGYHSVFRGRGMDFDEVREYVPGDDVRAIDWNVTARAGRPFIKKFREERELTIVLAVDLSASGDFGSHRLSKRELAAEVACILALAALRSRDKVGLLLFTDQVEQFIPPASGRGHVLRMVTQILTASPAGRGTDLSAALEHLNTVVPRRAAVLLISDLIEKTDEERERSTRVLSVTARRHELIALWVQDPHECTLPDVGVLTLEDAESGEVVVIDTSRKKVRSRFARLAAERRDWQSQRLRGAGARILALPAGGDYLPQLVAFFSGKQAGRGGGS